MAQPPHTGGKRGIVPGLDRKSTRLNSSHLVISYAVFCLKKKKNRDDVPMLKPVSPYHPYPSSLRHSFSNYTPAPPHTHPTRQPPAPDYATQISADAL